MHMFIVSIDGMIRIYLVEPFHYDIWKLWRKSFRAFRSAHALHGFHNVTEAYDWMTANNYKLLSEEHIIVKESYVYGD